MTSAPPRAPAQLSSENVAAMAAQVPSSVAAVVTTLEKAGHRAVVVGGAIRDLVLGIRPGDFDVASSATPQEVMALFRHTIPTGMDHGTITVMPAERDHPVEVTTFRTEEGYSDGRRPDRVTFVREVEADLSRRDFTINAMALALHPAPAFIDPFHGLADLHAGLLRTVGEADRRFGEDGLRALRAARFAAQLQLRSAEGLEDAMRRALPVIRGVAVERVQQELHKLLERAPRPSVGLSMMSRTGLMELCPGAPSDEASLARVDRAPPSEGAARWAAWLWDAGGATAKALVTALKGSRELADDVAALCGLPLPAVMMGLDDAALRARLRLLTRRRWDAARVMWKTESGDALLARVDALVAEGFLDGPAQLALNGHELQALGARGPAIGRTLQHLLGHVDRAPTENTREHLLPLARAYLENPP